MKADIENAAVRVAVKRSIRLKDIQFGYNHLLKWADNWKKKGCTPDENYVITCYRKWVKHYEKG